MVLFHLGNGEKILISQGCCEDEMLICVKGLCALSSSSVGHQRHLGQSAHLSCTLQGVQRLLAR